jgi:hypothetical protein
LLQAAGDDAPAAEPALLALTMAAAAAVRASWDDEALPPDAPSALFAGALAAAPERLTVKTAEGYAFYAVYPEAYREAARTLSPDTRVIGIRSIGAGLACVVAEAIGAPAPLTVRPVGPPFARTVALPRLDPALTYAVVDEGPGLSGSSFGAVADALEAQGVTRDRIVFLPGHAGDLGPQASDAHRRRWAAARRLHVGFEALIAPRLVSWLRGLPGVGAVQNLDDISGGAWRALTHGRDEAAWPPAAAHQERRKFLARTSNGAVLLKFVGLGATGEEAERRAGEMHACGFAPEPLGRRHGFLVERWVESRPARLKEIRAALPRYLAARARLTGPFAPGATRADLGEMMRINVTEALGPEFAKGLPSAPPESGSAVHVDARLHAWEWRMGADGRLLKTDGVDHALAHDLIGPQPIAWDLAGALVEHDLAMEPALDPFWPAAYAAFQLGLWTNAAQAMAGWTAEAERCGAQAERYANHLRRRLD